MSCLQPGRFLASKTQTMDLLIAAGGLCSQVSPWIDGLLDILRALQGGFVNKRRPSFFLRPSCALPRLFGARIRGMLARARLVSAKPQ